MLSVKEFAYKTGTTIKTVNNWIDKQYIPGVYIENGEHKIPDNARCPYTERRCKNMGDAMKKSILKAYSLGKNVVPQLYNITQEKLESINISLKRDGYIEEEFLDGLVYYNATEQGMKVLAGNKEAIKTISKLAVPIAQMVVNKITI